MMEYSEFKEFCRTKHKLDDVTEAEWKENHKNYENLSPNGSARRIKHNRQYDTVEGNFLGARDFTTRDKSLADTDTQVLYVWSKESGWVEMYWNGKFPNDQAMNKWCKFNVTRTKKGGYAGKQVTMTDRSFKPTRWGGWKQVTDFVGWEKPQDVWPTIAVVGEIAGIRAQYNFDLGEDSQGNYETYEADQHPNSTDPCCSVTLRSPGVEINVDFGPYKNGQLNNQFPDFNTEASPTIQDLEMNVKGAVAGFIGRLNGNPKQKVDKYTGESYVSIRLGAFAVFEMPDNAVTGEAAAQPVEHASATADDQESAKQLLTAVMNCMKDLCPEVTAAQLLQSKYVDDTIEESQVQFAIDMIKRQGNTPKNPEPKGAPAPAEDVSFEDEINIDWVKGHLMKQKDHTGEIEKLLEWSNGKEQEVDDVLTEMLDAGELYEPSLGTVALISVDR